MSSWSGVAEAYRDSFATLCGGTVDRLLADSVGGRHLDVGSGTGALAARASTLGRSVVAVDADPDMVAISHLAVPGRALVAALPYLPFDDDHFDAVTANFVVNHVGDPRAAVRELARVSRPGGTLAVTTWTTQAPAWGALVADAFAAAGAVPVPGTRLSPELDFERSVEGLRGLAEGAGLGTIRAEQLHWTWQIGVDDLWRGISGGVAGVGQTYLAQPAAVRRSAEREFRRAAGEMADHEMLSLPSTAAYVVGVV